MYEIAGGFIVHFFSKEKVEQLAKGYKSYETEEFEEGELPRKLYMVTMQEIRNRLIENIQIHLS